MNKKILIAAAALLVVGGGAGAYFFLAGSTDSSLAARPERGFIEPPDDGTEVTDPVTNIRCKKTFKTKSAVYEQKTYYFCCPNCPSQFLADMTKFADSEP